MSKVREKNYGSIVFITTLSVYLGLVLVGGATPIFAYSALTKEFNLRNEIEYKEDLENKPDEDLIFSGSGKTNEQKSFDTAADADWLALLSETSNWADCSKIELVSLSINVENNGSELKCFQPKRLSQAYSYPSLDNNSVAGKLAAPKTKQVERDLAIDIGNQQVLLVSRLPRAGLDPLLLAFNR